MLTDYGNPATCEYFMVNYTVPENAGSSLLFHNHEMEFVQIAADFPHIGFCLDTYWIAGHGQDPAYWIRKLGGRVPAVHLKDMADNGDFAPVYEGVLDFDSILLACRESGVRYLLVEQDDCCGGDPFECLKLSCDNLKARGI
jgi:sugar phosphate isomerase/epimerase